jgi:hypothetical protein
MVFFSRVFCQEISYFCHLLASQAVRYPLMICNPFDVLRFRPWFSEIYIIDI